MWNACWQKGRCLVGTRRLALQRRYRFSLLFTLYFLLTQCRFQAAIDVSAYSSPVELESLGLDRLKAALMALGLKCGG